MNQSESPVHRLKDLAVSMGFSRFIFLGIAPRGVGSISFGLDDPEDQAAFVESFLPVLEVSKDARAVDRDLSKLCDRLFETLGPV